MGLTVEQRRNLRSALMAAFPRQPRLELMVEDELGEDLNQITQGQSDYELVVRDLVKWADSQGRLRELVIGALWSIPGNPELGDFVQRNLGLPLQVHAFLGLLRLLSPIDASILREAYRKCLSGRSPWVSETRAALVARLAEIPGEPDEPKPLWCFVSILIKDPSLNLSQQQTLRDWAQAEGLPLPPGISISVLVPPEIVETYLMVKVKPRAVNDRSLGYLVSAAIVKDPDPWKLEVDLIEIEIDVASAPDPKSAPGYSKDDLPRVLGDLVAICGGKQHRIPLQDLIVQLFLPIELMSLPIDLGQIPLGRQRPCTGQHCKAVMVRSFDRHFLPDYESALGDWEKFWQHLLTCRDVQWTQALDPLDDPTWDQTRRLGWRFIEPDDQQQQESFWDNFLIQGLPVALWLRQPSISQQVAMQSVTDCSIAGLPSALTHHRREALSQAPDTTITDKLRIAPLALLWDNPFRPFPTLAYQS
jgi:hypothetical protein